MARDPELQDWRLEQVQNENVRLRKRLDRAEAELRDLLAIVEDDNDRSFHDCQCNWHLNLEAAKRRARAYEDADKVADG